MSRSTSKLVNSTEILEDILWLINEIKGAALYRTAVFLNNRRIYVNNILTYLKDPQKYPGKKNKIHYIVLKFIDDIISERYADIQKLNLSIKFVRKIVLDHIYHKKLRGNHH